MVQTLGPLLQLLTLLTLTSKSSWSDLRPAMPHPLQPVMPVMPNADRCGAQVSATGLRNHLNSLKRPNQNPPKVRRSAIVDELLVMLVLLVMWRFQDVSPDTFHLQDIWNTLQMRGLLNMLNTCLPGMPQLAFCGLHMVAILHCIVLHCVAFSHLSCIV